MGWMAPLELAPEYLLPCHPLPSCSIFKQPELLAIPWTLPPLSSLRAFVMLLPLSEKSLANSRWLCRLPCMMGFLDHAYGSLINSWALYGLPVMHSTHLSEGFPERVTELTQPLDNIPQWISCVSRARPCHGLFPGPRSLRSVADHWFLRYDRMGWGEIMRHLPQVQNVRGANKLSSEDNTLQQYFFKSKLCQKIHGRQTINILNKDRISESAQRKSYGFRCLF